MKINKNIGNSKISEEQIERLYRFTREHFVEHYDLQTELVDHLALMIEDIWQTEPELPFESALQKAFKSFGVFGFTDIVHAKQKYLYKKYLNWIFNEMKTLLYSFKIIYVFSLIVVFYFFFHFAIAYRLIGLFYLLSIGLGLGFMFYKSNQYQKNYQNKKRLYLEEVVKNNSYVGLILFTPFAFGNGMKDVLLVSSQMSFLILLFLAVFSSLLCLYVYVSTIVLPNKHDEYLETYVNQYKT